MMALRHCAGRWHALAYVYLALSWRNAEALEGRFPYGTLSLLPRGNDGIRLRVAPPGMSIVDPAVQALLPLAANGSVDGTHAEAPHTAITQGNLLAIVDDAGLVTFTRVSDGKLLLNLTAIAFGPAANGTAAGAVSAVATFSGLAPGEKVYGLGEHAGRGVGMTNFSSSWADNNNGELTIGWLVSSVGYGLLHNYAGYGNVSISASAQTWAVHAAFNVDIWITTHPADSVAPMASILGAYADAVGHAPPMPYAASGFWQSKNRYRNQTQLLDVVAGHIERALPLSVIVVDYLTWRVLGDDTLTSECWPDPAGMAATLSKANITLMFSFYPYQNNGSRYYDAFVSGNLSAVNVVEPGASFGGCLNGETIYDPFNADARRATFDAWNVGYRRYAAAAAPNSVWMWQDCSEPGRANGRNGQWHYAAGMDSEVGAAWPREHARTVSERVPPAGVALTLTRSFYPGSNIHGVVLWSGDIATTFESLAYQVRIAQATAMSGVALWCSDTGGYTGGNASDPVFRELIVRWTQFSAFTPIFRFHGKRLGGDAPDQCGPTNGDNSPWSFGDEAFTAIRSVMLLREMLRGYVMDAHAEVVRSGLPIVRPLALAFPADVRAADAVNEGAYMFGGDYLVAPVTAAGATSMNVYLPRLPSGSSWRYYFNTSATPYPSGESVTVQTPLEEFPLFVRDPPIGGSGL